MGNLSFRPWTELFEVVKDELVRDSGTDSALEAKYKMAVNEAYAIFLPEVLDEKYLRKEASITTLADYVTGTIDISAGATTVDGGDTSPAWTSALANNKIIKVTGKNERYRMTYTSATQLTFSNSRTWIEAAVNEGSYVLFQDRYALASDFKKIIKDIFDDGRVVYYNSNNGQIFLNPLTNEQYEYEFTAQPGTPFQYTVKWVDGVPYLYITPPDTDTRAIWYSYLPDLTYLTEYVTGTASCTNGATAVTGSSTDFDGFVGTDTNAYFRFDGDGTGSDSRWYQISSAGSDTAITLASAYGGATKSAANYTISKISKLPKMFDQVIMLRAALMTDPDPRKWNDLLNGLLLLHISNDTKRIIGQKLNFSWQDWRK